MDLLERISALKIKQHEIEESYETIYNELKSSNYINENKELKAALDSCQKELEAIRKELEQAHRENDQLKLALQEQVWSERLNILKISRQKLDVYFQDIQQKEKNNLVELEIDVRTKLNVLKAKVAHHLQEEKESFSQRISELEQDMLMSLKLQEEQMQHPKKEVLTDAYAKLGALGEAELPPEILKERARQNQIEMKIGLNWINRFGIFLILLGVGAAFQYSFKYFNDYWKGISFFMLGGLFMLAGEFFFRKKKEIFSMGLLGGGVAILYGSIFYSFFALKILPLEIALILSVLVTASTVILSIRYNSITIGAFGLIGGFLPFLSWVMAFGLNNNNAIFLMGYLLILNLSVLLIGVAKRWSILNWISFLLNISALVYLNSQQLNFILCITYTTITCLLYLSIVLAYPFLRQKRLNIGDVTLLALNTVISSTLLFNLVRAAGFRYWLGVIALMFGLIYLGLGQFIQKKLPGERWTQLLFYSTALTFAILIIPFQFDKCWLTLGWLIEGILLIVLGSRNKMKYIEMAGWGLFLLCCAIFGALDVLPSLLYEVKTRFFELKYLAFTAGQIIILINYLQQFVNKEISRWSEKGQSLLVYKYITAVLCWVYLIHIALLTINKYIGHGTLAFFYQWMFIALISACYGMGIDKIKLLTDKVIHGLAIGLYLFVDCIGLALTLFYPVGPVDAHHINTSSCFAIGLLVLYNILVFLNIKYLLFKWIHRQGNNFEFYPLLLGIYLFANCNALLIIQFHLSQVNLLLSLIYLIMAITFIGYGFARRFMYIRRLGLALTLFATGKLFIYDLSYLKSVGRIVAFFAFGIVLLLISFIYQRVKNSLEATHHDTQVL